MFDRNLTVVLISLAAAATAAPIPSAAERGRSASGPVPERAVARGSGETTWGGVDASGVAIEGGVWDFEGGPLGTLQGWTSEDRTDIVGQLGVLPVRRVTSSDFSGAGDTDATITAGGSTHSMWIGAPTEETIEGCWPGGQGYSNGWRLGLTKEFTYDRFGDVTIDVDYFVESEPGWDFTYVYVTNEGVRSAPLNTSLAGNFDDKGWSGNPGTPSSPAHETMVAPASVLPGEHFSVVFEFQSDWVISDGLDRFPESNPLNTSYGAVGIDNIRVTGAGALDDLSDFETGLDDWIPYAWPVGDFMQVADLSTLDPVGDPIDCPLSGSVLIASDLIGWAPHPIRQHVVMESPPIYVGEHPGEDRLVRFDIWEDLPKSNGVGLRVALHYYPWTCPTDPDGGDRWTEQPADDEAPVFDPTTGGNVNGFLFDGDFEGPTCGTFTLDRSLGVPSDVDSLKIVFEIFTSCDDFGVVDCTAEQTNLSPYIDNVQLVSVPACGRWTASELGTAGVKTYGSSWGDYDGDGDQDLHVVEAGSDRLYRNDDGELVDVTVPPLNDASAGRSARWADADNDGDLDLYLLVDGANKFFRNDGGTFIDRSSGVLADAGAGASMTWIDYDADGNLDLYLINSGANQLIRNTGSGYVEATPSVFGFPQDGSAAWADFDDDGDMDVYLGVDQGANRLLRNDGAGSFVNVACCGLDDAGSVAAVSWVDYDNDGDMDLFVARLVEANLLFRNDGGTFVEVAASMQVDAPGPKSSTALWLDVDNDGDQDLYVVNETSPSTLFINGGRVFIESTPAVLAPSASSRGSAAAADMDADGDLDLHIGHVGSENEIAENLCAGRNWLDVRLIGTSSNRSGIGARVRVLSDGTTQTQEYTAATGRTDQSGTSLHFGLGSGEVDDVTIRWPSGIEERVAPQGSPAIPSNTTIWAIEGQGIVVGTPEQSPALSARLVTARPNPFNPRVEITYELARPGDVSLAVYDTGGRLVAVLDSGLRGAGHRTAIWDGRDLNAEPAASGVYFVRLASSSDARTEHAVRKIVLAR